MWLKIGLVVFNSKIKKLTFIGASTLWLIMNDVIFDKSPNTSYMHVFFRATHWLRLREENKELSYFTCQNLEVTVMQIFASYMWRFTNRLQ